VTNDAENAWHERNERTATPRKPYLAGYEDGAFDERLRVTAFLAENMATISEYAGDRTPALLEYMFREMHATPIPAAGRTEGEAP
jgi:hypothetical protein